MERASPTKRTYPPLPIWGHPLKKPKNHCAATVFWFDINLLKYDVVLSETKPLVHYMKSGYLPDKYQEQATFYDKMRFDTYMNFSRFL